MTINKPALGDTSWKDEVDAVIDHANLWGGVDPDDVVVDADVTAAIAAHSAAADPHAGYLTAAEGNAAYQPRDDDLTALSGVTVVSFGADPTGAASSTTAFQDAIDAGDVLIPAGTYKVGHVSYEGSESRRIVALGPATIIQTSSSGVFTLRGGWDLIGTVSSYATTAVTLPFPGEPTPGSTISATTVLTMSSAVSLNFGDVVKIVSNDQIVTAPSSSSRRGEYALIPKAVSSSTTVPLSNVLIETYTTNVRLARLWDVRFEISGPLIFDVDSSLADMTSGEPVVYLKAAQNCYVGGGVEFHNSRGRALSNFAFGTHVDGVKFRGLANRPSFTQFGYGVEDCGWQLRMTGCTGENLRHLYTDNDGDTTAGSTVFENFGGGWFAHVADCVAFGTSASSFDTHGTAYGTVFADCHAYGAYVGADTGGTGFSARGRKITFMNCVADQCYRGFQTKAHDTTFVNCRAQRTLGPALEVSKDSGSSLTTLNATVVGGLYESVGFDEYVNAYLGTSGTTINVDIQGARFRKLTAPTNGLRMFEIDADVNLKFADLTIDWEDYSRDSGDELITFRLTGDDITILGRRLYHLCGSTNVASFTVFKSSTAAADDTVIEVYDVDHRHNDTAATVLDSPLTAGRVSFRQHFGDVWFQRTGSNDLTMVASAGAVLPIADKLDPIVAVRLSGSSGAVSLAAIPDAGLVPGQVLHVGNESNGTVTVHGLAIPVDGVGSFVFLRGSWWTLG